MSNAFAMTLRYFCQFIRIGDRALVNEYRCKGYLSLPIDTRRGAPTILSLREALSLWCFFIGRNVGVYSVAKSCMMAHTIFDNLHDEFRTELLIYGLNERGLPVVQCLDDRYGDILVRDVMDDLGILGAMQFPIGNMRRLLLADSIQEGRP